MQHELIARKRSRGGSPIQGMRGTSGTDVKCSCGGWSDFTNEAPPSRSQTWQKRVFAQHVEAITLEGDIERGRELLAQATERLANRLADGEDLPSYIESATQRIAAIGTELAADLHEARYGFRKQES